MDILDKIVVEQIVVLKERGLEKARENCVLNDYTLIDNSGSGPYLDLACDPGDRAIIHFYPDPPLQVTS